MIQPGHRAADRAAHIKRAPNWEIATLDPQDSVALDLHNRLYLAAGIPDDPHAVAAQNFSRAAETYYANAPSSDILTVVATYPFLLPSHANRSRVLASAFATGYLLRTVGFNDIVDAEYPGVPLLGIKGALPSPGAITQRSRLPWLRVQRPGNEQAQPKFGIGYVSLVGFGRASSREVAVTAGYASPVTGKGLEATINFKEILERLAMHDRSKD